MSSGTLTAIRLNGVAVPEAVINAAIGGHFGVPVVMISGDDAIAREARNHLGDIETAILKWNYGFHSAMTLMPEAGKEIIAEKVWTALNRLDDFEPYRLEGPITVEVSFKNYLAAELMAYLPIVERVDSHTIAYTGADMIEISRFLEFLTNYRPDITP
jgi:D-amino peptidase